MVLLSSALSHARREWQMIRDNPMRDVRKPAEPPARDRLPTWGELRRLRYVAGSDLTQAQARAFHAFGFAMRTGMRAGEICALEWSDIGDRTAKLHRSKTGAGRVVPLSSHARRMLDDLRPVTGPAGPVFRLRPPQLDALWRKVRSKAGVEGLTFHDSRAAALTALSRRVDVLTLARISGHKDVSLLMRVYYRESPDDLAERLG
jgi:integrase